MLLTTSGISKAKRRDDGYRRPRAGDGRVGRQPHPRRAHRLHPPGSCPGPARGTPRGRGEGAAAAGVFDLRPGPGDGPRRGAGRGARRRGTRRTPARDGGAGGGCARIPLAPADRPAGTARLAGAPGSAGAVAARPRSRGRHAAELAALHRRPARRAAGRMGRDERDPSIPPIRRPSPSGRPVPTHPPRASCVRCGQRRSRASAWRRFPP